MKWPKEIAEVKKLIRENAGCYNVDPILRAVDKVVRAVREDCAKEANQDEGYIIKKDGERVCEDCGNAIAAAIREGR